MSATVDAELAAELARLQSEAMRQRNKQDIDQELRRLLVKGATAEEVACDCARLRLEVAQLKRTEARLREADERQRLTIAEQAAAIGALQEKLKITERQLLVLRAEEGLWRVVLTRAEQERDEARREFETYRAEHCSVTYVDLPPFIITDPEARRAIDVILRNEIRKKREAVDLRRAEEEQGRALKALHDIETLPQGDFLSDLEVPP